MRLPLLLLLTSFGLAAATPAPPVRGLHLSAPSADDLPLALRFIREALPKEAASGRPAASPSNFR